MTTHTLLHTSDCSHILWHRPSNKHCGLVHSSSLVWVRNWNKLELLALSTELLVSMCCITCAGRSWTHWTACSPLTGMAILRNKIGEGCAAIIVDIWRKEKTLETMLNKHTETGLWGLLLELISNSQSIMSLPYLCLVLFPAFSACVEPVEGRKSFGAEQWLEFHWLTGEARFPVDSSTTKGRMGSTEWQQLWRPSWQH